MDKSEAIALAEILARSVRSTIVIEGVASELIPADYAEYDTNRIKTFGNDSMITIVPLPF